MKRPLGYCFVGWIVGESMSYFLDVRVAMFISFILTLVSSIFWLIVSLDGKNKKEGYVSASKGKEKKRRGISLFYQINGEKCKNKTNIGINILVLFCSFSFLASVRFYQEIKLPAFYEQVKKEGKVSLRLNGIIIEQKKTTSGISLVLDDVYVLTDKKKEKIPKKVIVYEVSCEYLMGQRIEGYGEFSLQKEPTNPGEFNSYLYYRAKGIYGSFFCKQVLRVYGNYAPVLELARRMRVNLGKVYQNLFSEEEAGIVEAILLGEKSGLSEEIKILYQDNGISHILAISGLHISFFGRNVYKRLRKFHVSFFSCAFFAASFLLFYGYIAGFSHSTFRAIIMLLLTFLGDVIGRSYDLVSAVYFAGILLLARQPFCLFDAGALLSFGAVLGIGLIFPILQAIFCKKKEKTKKRKIYLEKLQEKIQSLDGERWRWKKSFEKRLKVWMRKERLSDRIKRSLGESLLSSISIQIVTIPTLLRFYYELPTYGIALNLIILPLLSFLLPAAVLAGILGSIRLPLGRFFALATSIFLQIYKSLAKFCLKLPFSKWTVGNMHWYAIILYAVGIASILFFLYSRIYIEKTRAFSKGLCYIFVMTLSFFLCLSVQAKQNEMKLVMLDVGQGDGILMKLPGGANAMIDGGSSSKDKLGTYVLLPALKYYGMGHLDYAFVSHEDSDHISGLVELLEKKYPIKNLILPYREKEEKEKNYLALLELAKKNKVNIIFWKKYDKIKTKKFILSCLHPKWKNQEGEQNADSMVLSLQYSHFRILFTGDLADGGEDALVEELRESENPSYTFLKVPHHGSKKSTFEPLLNLVRPKLSLISCSATNRYGHPGKETLKRLEKIGSEVLITKDVGAMEFHILENGKIWKTLFASCHTRNLRAF